MMMGHDDFDENVTLTGDIGKIVTLCNLEIKPTVGGSHF